MGGRVKYLIGFAIGWTVARHLAGAPIVPRQLTAFVTPEQLPPPPPLRGFLQ